MVQRKEITASCYNNNNETNDDMIYGGKLCKICPNSASSECNNNPANISNFKPLMGTKMGITFRLSNHRLAINRYIDL